MGHGSVDLHLDQVRQCRLLESHGLVCISKTANNRGLMTKILCKKSENKDRMCVSVVNHIKYCQTD